MSSGATGQVGSKGRRRREQILDAAVELFGEVGYRGTSLRDIAERVGITHPGLLYHFHSKQELLSAVLARRDEGSTDEFHLEEGPGSRDLAERLLGLLHQNAETPGMVELFAMLSAEATDEDHPAHDYFTQRYQRVVAQVQRMFERLDADGELREGSEPRVLARTLVAIMDGLQVQWLYEPDSVDMGAIVRAYLAGVLVKPV